MAKLRFSAGIFFAFITLTISCNSKLSKDANTMDSTEINLRVLDSDRKGDSSEFHLVETKMKVQEIRKLTTNVTGDFTAFKVFLKSLNKYSLFSIAQSESYVKQFLPKVKSEYRDSTYLYFLMNFYAIANNQSDSLYTKFPATIKKLESGKDETETKDFHEFLDLFGLQLFTSEGTHYLDVNANYFSAVFDGAGSDALSEYLRLRSQELSEGFSEDAGLMITFKDDYERVVRWEAFLSKYPNSALVSQAKYYHGTYLETLLTGMDNSRVFDENKKLIPEVKNLYESVVATGPKTKSTEIITGYYNLLRANGFTYSENLDKYLTQQGLHSMLAIQPHTR